MNLRETRVIVLVKKVYKHSILGSHIVCWLPGDFLKKPTLSSGSELFHIDKISK